MKKPLLSICIPTYNRGNILYNTILNVLKYGGVDIELIVSDNASTDNTLDIIQSIKDDRFIYYRNQQNMGFVYNLLKVIEYANADFVFLLSDEDDICVKNIDKILQILSMNKNLSVFLGNIKTDTGKNYLNYKDELIKNSDDAFLKFSFTHHYMSGLILNKKSIDLNNIWSEFEKPNHGYLDIYPHVYIMNCLFFTGLAQTSNLCFVKMREKGKCEMDTFNNKPYVHPNSRINLFIKNISSLTTFPISKDKYMKVFKRLYKWTLLMIYYYYDSIELNNQHKKHFDILRSNENLKLDIEKLEYSSTEILLKNNLNINEIKGINTRIKYKYIIIHIKRKIKNIIIKILKRLHKDAC